MHIRLACLLALVVGACAATSQVADSDSILDELRAQNKGMILFDISLYCVSVSAWVSHPDAEGHYVIGDLINLVPTLHRVNEPSQVVLPAGDYPLVQITCSQGTNTQNFLSRKIKQGNLLLGEHAAYEQPIVKFSVGPGEIVDIGSVSLPTRGGILGFGGSFGAVVAPISEAKLKAFATRQPNLYAHVVHRAMTTPGQQRPIAATPLRRSTH